MNTVMDEPHTEETKFTCGQDRLGIAPAGDIWSARDGDPEQLYVGFTCRNFGPYGAQEEEVLDGIKNGGRQKQKCNLGTSALFTRVNK